MMQKQEESAPLPGVMATIAAGFDLTARHLWLALIPVLLDIFYWLGPRLSVSVLMERLLSWQPAVVAMSEVGSQLLELAPRINLFTVLSVPFMGVPAMMAGNMPEKTPLESRVIQLESFAQWAGLFVGLSVAGLLLTAAYYHLIAGVVSDRERAEEKQEVEKKAAPASFLGRVGRLWLRLLATALIFLAGLMIISIPLLPFFVLSSLISRGLATAVFFLGSMVAFWLVIFISFTPQGLALNGRSLRQALTESVKLVQLNVMPVLFLVAAIMVLGMVLDWLLWSVEGGSWLTLSSILAHAFVSTAFVVATFIFYQDRYALLLKINDFVNSRNKGL